jgi:hypothetical protein
MPTVGVLYFGPFNPFHYSLLLLYHSLIVNSLNVFCSMFFVLQTFY